MENDRAAAKRRASFGRADRLRKEAQQKAEQTKIDQRRKAERDKVDQQLKAQAVKAAEQRVALARKRAEQRRLKRKQDNLKQEFARKAADRRAQTERAERKAEPAKVADRKQTQEQEQRRREAAAFIKLQEQRQHADQRDEHRRQTSRLRAEHQAQRSGFDNRRAAGIIHHAQKIRNIDLAEQRELNAFDQQRNSLKGRVTELVRGSKHFDRQEQAIVDRHENDRWAKHREQEARQDSSFFSEQKTRQNQALERMAMAKDHGTERHQLTQTHERVRSHQIEARAQAMTKAIDNQRQQQQENKRPREAFGHAAGQSLEIKR